jgi:hypothetical protein
MIVAFASRFCGVPTRADFVTRMEVILHYVYSVGEENLKTEANPENNPWTNMALSNLISLRDITLFTDRMDYIMEIFHFSQRKLKQNIRADIILEKNEKEHADETSSECSICYEEKNESQCAELNCGHAFCGDCIVKTMKVANAHQIRCSLCRTSVTQIVVADKEMEIEMRRYVI